MKQHPHPRGRGPIPVASLRQVPAPPPLVGEAPAPARFYAGLFLMTACTLMLQVLQTRILSVVVWYHLAFFAISMAMFGLTAGAVFVYVRRERYTPATLADDLAYFSSVFGVFTVVCVAVQMTLAPTLAWSIAAVLTWVLLALCMAVPFFFSGIVVSLALTRSPLPIGRVYGVDLLGAAAGCLGVLLVLNATDGPSGVIWTGAAGACAAALFASSKLGATRVTNRPLYGVLSRRRTVAALLGAAALANGLSPYGLQPVFSKGSFEGGRTHAYRKWNTFSRVAVHEPYVGVPHMWGPSPRLDPSVVVEQRPMNIDGDAGTTALRFDGNLEALDFLRYDVTNLAYYLPGRRRAAIIGVGGGRDVLSAAVFGYRDITGIELNPVFIHLLTREPGYREFTNVSALPGLRLVADEGRSWLARSGEQFDLIQMSLIDTWAATGAGAFSLSENGLYTVEAWKIFLERLSPEGVYTVSRWYNPSDPNETARLLSLATAALLERGVSDPRRHIVLATQASIATLLVARAPFSAPDLETLRRQAARLEHRIVLSPSTPSESLVLDRIVSARTRAALDERSGYAFDLTPPTDDRPFFFNQVPLDKPLDTLRIAASRIGHPAAGGIVDGNLVASATLVMLFLVSLALVLATIVLPLRSAIRNVGRGLAVGGTLYFLLIGLGFMLIEIGLLQRTSVFLGHPVYSLSVLLFTLILATGIGSLASERVRLDTTRRIAGWAVLTAAYVSALPFVLDRVFLSFDASTMLVKSVLSVGVIAPAGVLMGFGFPTGMRLSSRVNPGPTPWFWGVNGAAGVLASTSAIACSIAFGIGVTVRVGALCYLLLIPVAAVLVSERRRAPATVAHAEAL